MSPKLPISARAGVAPNAYFQNKDHGIDYYFSSLQLGTFSLVLTGLVNNEYIHIYKYIFQMCQAICSNSSDEGCQNTPQKCILLNFGSKKCQQTVQPICILNIFFFIHTFEFWSSTSRNQEKTTVFAEIHLL